MDIPKMKRKDFIQFLEKKEKYLEDLEQMIKVYKKDDGFKLSYQLNTIDIIQELYFNIANAKYKVDIPDH